jgi:hypothetical protein
MKPFIAAAMILAAFVAPAQAGNCGVLYRQQQVRQHHVYQQAIVHAPAHYSVALDIQLDAVAQRIADKVEALQQKRQAQTRPVGPAQATVLAAKCARCHSGAEPKGGVLLDGSPLTSADKWRIVEILGAGKDVPQAMKTLVAGMAAEDKGAITDELVAIPEPPPEPPSQPGVLE